MGTFDISRINFSAPKHYKSVRMQQGRVITDDDWNENERIQDDDTRRSKVDIIGGFGSPDDGFKIVPLLDAAGNPLDLVFNENGTSVLNFTIKEGTLYVGGMRLEMDQDETFRLQSDWLQQDRVIDAGIPPGNAAGQFDLVYVEAWEQPVSAIEDNSLFEVALGGPDTSVRVKNMRRVRVFPNVGSDECPIAWARLKDEWIAQKLGHINRAFQRVPDTKLTVSLANGNLPKDLCSPTISGSYLGAENQAIRVQIVDAQNFIWGFDDAAPYYRVLLVRGRNTFKILTEPKDQYHWPAAKQVIEILPWSAVLPNGEKVAEESGWLSKVSVSYDPDSQEFTIQNGLPPLFGEEWTHRTDEASLEELDTSTVPAKPINHFYLRVWNRGDDLNSAPTIAIPAAPATAALGNTGIEVSFTGNEFVPNDYWVIAARPASPQVIVPWELLDGAAPHGVKRFFAPLGIIAWTQDAQGAISGKIVNDCRKKFNPLTDQECCCTYTVGDGVYSHGDFYSIQEAVDALPPSGGKVCVLPGIHQTRAVIYNRKFVHITGCGERSILWAFPPRNQDLLSPTLIEIRNSRHIRIDNLTMFTSDGTAILVKDIDEKRNVPSAHITIRENWLFALVNAIRVQVLNGLKGGNFIDICHNKITMFDKPRGDVAIFSLADEVRIERNRIVLYTPKDRGGGDDGGGGKEPPFDDCDCDGLKKIFHNKEKIRQIIAETIDIVDRIIPSLTDTQYVALGGIQIGCSSDTVRILANEIIGGKGCGVLIGHRLKEEKIFPFIYRLFIEDNQIYRMGRAGIGVFQLAAAGDKEQHQEAVPPIVVDRLTIYRNVIKWCALQIQQLEEEKNLPEAAYGGIILSMCQSGVITENRIINNGRVHTEPVCGIFIQLGLELDISSNYINDNAPRMINIRDGGARPGHRGGIVVLLAMQLFTSDSRREEDGNDTQIPLYSGINAIKLHDNVVRQPLGHALLLTLLGPASIVSNQFVTAGIDPEDRKAALAATVLIIDLGISKDLFSISRSSFGQMKLVYNSKTTSYRAIGTTESPAANQLFEIWPSGKIMFAANQVMLDLRTIELSNAFTSQLILTLDDIAYNTNQSECAGFIIPLKLRQVSDRVLTDVFLMGVTVRANDNRFTEGVTDTDVSLSVLGRIAIAAHNEATHCIIIVAPDKVENPNIVILEDPKLCPARTHPIITHFFKNS